MQGKKIRKKKKGEKRENQQASLLSGLHHISVITVVSPRPFPVVVTLSIVIAPLVVLLILLILLWMLLLPIGRTLTLPEWLSERGSAVERWKQEQVPGAAVRCFLVNLALVYILAGPWKWTSPLWRQGLAVYAVLKTAVSRTPDRWKPRHLPTLITANHLSLVLEPLFPLAFVLPANHPLKWSLGAAMIGFHAGIIATMKIPFANVACIAASALVFRGEIMAWLR